MTNRYYKPGKLERKADEILRADKLTIVGSQPAVVIEMLSENDLRGKEVRQLKLRSRYPFDLINRDLAPDISTPEEILIRTEKEQQAKQYLATLIRQLDQMSRIVLMAVILHDVNFRSNRELSEFCQMDIEEVKTAKARIKYQVRKSGPLCWDTISNATQGEK